MKIKSITDVITNSSTEVWAIKTPILEEAKAKFFDESWRKKTFGEDGEQENLYECFVDFPDLKSILEAWETLEGNEAIYEFIPEELRCLLRPYKLTNGEARILRIFGHSKEELLKFQDDMNSKRLAQLQEKASEFSKYLGWSVAVFHAHYSMWGGHEAGKKLKNWLQENHKNRDDWWYDY